MNEPTITITGNLTKDPEVRLTRNGTTIANFTIAATPSTYNQTNQNWESGETIFMRCEAWKTLGENIVETLCKGSRVIATGRLSQETWTGKDGEKRSSMKLTVDEIGQSLRYLPKQGGYNAGSPALQTVTQPDPNDPWANQTIQF